MFNSFTLVNARAKSMWETFGESAVIFATMKTNEFEMYFNVYCPYDKNGFKVIGFTMFSVGQSMNLQPVETPNRSNDDGVGDDDGVDADDDDGSDSNHHRHHNSGDGMQPILMEPTLPLHDEFGAAHEI